MLYLSLFYDSDISLIDNGLKMEDMKVAATITNHILQMIFVTCWDLLGDNTGSAVKRIILSG